MTNPETNKPKLLIMASWGARGDPSSPLLRFVRDHAGTLRQFEVHATEGTYHSILGTGLYKKDEVVSHRSGPEGGVVEMAALVARRDCEVFIFFSDPKDHGSDVPENRALQRLCKELQIRLITTLAGAEQWVVYEAKGVLKEHRKQRRSKKRRSGPTILPPNWREGLQNMRRRGEPAYHQIEKQTLALISHDKKKEEMVLFVNKHHDFLSCFHRILTTGTTGYLIKLLFSQASHYDALMKEATDKLGERRSQELEENFWYIKLVYCDGLDRPGIEDKARIRLKDTRYGRVATRAQDRRVEWEEHEKVIPGLTGPDQKFANNIMPLPSGPQGGDVLIASEVLNNRCDAVVFIQDPGTAQPHDPDIRLFERTCQFWSIGKDIKQAYATCVSDAQSADLWAQRLKKAFPPNHRPIPHLAHRLRQKFKLRDVILVDGKSDKDADDLGTRLARACAGYLHRRLSVTAKKGRDVRIGVGHGWTIRQVLEELKKMNSEDLFLKPRPLPGRIIWSPLVGNLTVVFTNREASVIANDFQKYYGGEVEAFQAGGFVDGNATDALPKDDERLIQGLAKADLMIVSAAPWNKNATLIKKTALSHAFFPKFRSALGTMSVVFLDRDGAKVKSSHYAVGLEHEGFQKAAKRGSVILVCGGASRRATALAALRGGLVSVLVTTRRTAEYLLR